MHYSHKIKQSIEKNIIKIIEHTFEESEIKALIIDLRESAKYHLKDLSNADHINATKQFLEIADFIAHTNRTRGTMEANIRCFAEQCLEALLAADGDQIMNHIIPPVANYLKGDMIALGLTINAQHFLEQFEECAINIADIFKEAFKVKEEIALCVISILQGSFIELQKGHGSAVLNIVVHNGQYRLYCKLQNSKIEPSIFKTNKLVEFNFPVIITNAPDIDNVLHQNMSSDIVGYLETYRDEAKVLHMRRHPN
jgi:hypothetical protein